MERIRSWLWGQPVERFSDLRESRRAMADAAANYQRDRLIRIADQMEERDA